MTLQCINIRENITPRGDGNKLQELVVDALGKLE